MTSSPLKVLVVEDEPFTQILLREKLESFGAKVIGVARSTKKGLELAKTVDADIALLDVFLESEFSFPIAKVLEQRGIPYIYVTGHPIQIDLNGDYLATSVEKPFRSADLKAAIDRSFSRHNGRKEANSKRAQSAWQKLLQKFFYDRRQ